jgi:putative transposase
MGLARSSNYDASSLKSDDAKTIATIAAICDEFEAYGYRPVSAELRHRGIARQFQENPPPHAQARPETQAA